MSSQEGLICPQCMKIFDSVKVLQQHFPLCQIDQSSFSKDKTGIIGILKKAKRTVEDILDSKNAEIFLTGSFSPTNPFLQNNIVEEYISYAFYEKPNIKPQPSGVTVNRTDEFINFRKMKLQSTSIETSNLIMRIEKLLSFPLNKNSMERKDFEQTVVEWVQDDLVPMCPSCGLKFGLNLSIKSTVENPIILSSKDDRYLLAKKTFNFKSKISSIMNFEIEGSGPYIKKKHHCRLCGGLICSVCSFMLPTSEANRLIASVNSRLELRESLWQGSGNLSWKEDSETSLDSIKSKIKQKEYCIRCCENCKIQIESKCSNMEKSVVESDVLVIYKDLITEINKTTELLSKFQNMYLSLSSGETDYSYQEASQMRSDIVKRCQQIDVLGNRFKSKSPVSGSAKEAALFNAVYRNAYLFLQNNFATLKYLPSEDEFKALADQKLIKIREEISNENKSKARVNQVNRITDNKFEDGGWAPSLKTNGAVPFINPSNSNPFEVDQENTELSNVALQIENVRCFIDQARKAKKFKDVEILQRNMIDLETEYDLLQKKLYAS